MIKSNTNSLKRQNGVMALFTTVIILILSTIIVLYVNRSAITEQKTAVAQYRTTQAFEAAEAGMAKILADFQVQTAIDSYIDYAAGNSTIKSTKYFNLLSLDTGDKFNAGIYMCRPYAISTAADRCKSSVGSFSLGDITPDANRRNVIRILSIGTADGCNPTLPANNTQTEADKFAANCNYKAMLITDFFPAKNTIPSIDALITTGTASLFGSQCVQNLTGEGNAVRTAGPTDNSTTNKNSDCTSPNSKGVFGPTVQNDTTLPPTSSVSLLNAANTGQFFKNNIFGETPAQVYAKSSIQQTGGSLPDSISGGYAWFNGAYTLTGNKTYGSPSSPVALIVDGTLAIHGNVTCYCIIFVNGSLSMTGGAVIYGGVAVDGTATINGGNNTIIKDQNVLDAFGKPFRFDTVAGSWKDW